VRTWFLEPVETEQSGLPAEQPAEGEAVGQGRLRLVGAREPVAGLQLTMELALHRDAPLLSITHTLRNLRDDRRRLAAWAINAVTPAGVGFTAWRPAERRSLVFYHDTRPDEPAVQAGETVLAVDYRKRPSSPFCKVGTDTTCGWGAFVWNGMALKSSVVADPDAQYPEGGVTVSFFSSQHLDDGRFGEVENVGPLTDVDAGGVVRLEQSLTLIGGLTGDEPAGWVGAIAKAE
jgi:hypothetical protein